MKKIILFTYLFVISSISYSMDLKKFNEGESIKADEYNDNFILIKSEIEKREFSPNFNYLLKNSGEVISVEKVEQDFNSVLELFNKPQVVVGENHIKSERMNEFFQIIEDIFKEESVNSIPCIVSGSTGCIKNWNENTESYDWVFACYPNYDKGAASCNKKNDVNYSVIGTGSWQHSLIVQPGQSIEFSCSGYVKLGSSGGFNCSGNIANYTGYRIVGNCHTGAPVYRELNGGSQVSVGCAYNNTVYTNNSTQVRELQFIINDTERGNNSGALGVNVKYRNQP